MVKQWVLKMIYVINITCTDIVKVLKKAWMDEKTM